MKTYNVELTFKESLDHQFWLDTLQLQREVFNTLSPIIWKLPQRNSLKINHDAVYYVSRSLFPDFPSQFTVKTEQELTANYKSSISNKHPIVKDGQVLDADWNASINIAQRFSKHLESCPIPKDGTLHFSGRLLSTNQTQVLSVS